MAPDRLLSALITTVISRPFRRIVSPTTTLIHNRNNCVVSDVLILLCWTTGYNQGVPPSIATLNVASLCMHQDEVTVSREVPTLTLFTETCLTEHVYRTVQGKARRHRKFLVPGGICAPRKSAHKSDSHARGESGGVLICSDLPARNGNIPLDQMTWLSNRVVESIVSLPTGLTIRVVGIYGYSKRYPGHIELTNQLLSACLKFVPQSTIPCVFLGDFNCDLQELSSWKMLQDKGWVDSALLQSSRDGKPPLPT